MVADDSSASTEAGAGGGSGAPSAGKRRANGHPGIWPRVLITLAAVILMVSMLTTWARSQLLDTGGWTQTSVRLLRNENIRTELSSELSTKLLDTVDVEQLAKDRLPKQLQPIAPLLSSAAANIVPQAIDRLLQTPQVEAIWAEVNRRAHHRLIQVLDGGTALVHTNGGVVSIDLHELLNRLGEQLGVGAVGDKLPNDKRELVLLRSDQLKLGQQGLKAAKILAFVLPALAIALFLLALWLAEGARRRLLLEAGVAMVVAALASLLLRRWVESYVVDGLVKQESVKPAVSDALSITTAGWRAEGLWILINGLLVILLALFAGPTRIARRLRQPLAGPIERYPIWFAAGAAVLVLLFATLGPAHTPGQAIPLLVELVLVVLGVLALRRQMIEESTASPPEPAIESTTAG